MRSKNLAKLALCVSSGIKTSFLNIFKLQIEDEITNVAKPVARKLTCTYTLKNSSPTNTSGNFLQKFHNFMSCT